MSRIALLLLFVVAVALPKLADPSNAGFASPRSQIEATYGQIQAGCANARNEAELDAQVAQIIEDMVSWEAFSSRTLGETTWQAFDAQQKAGFVSAYKALIIRKYAGTFDPQPEKPFEVEYRGEEALNPTIEIVRTTVFSYEDAKRVGVDVDYRFVFEEGRGHLIGDIVTDTVSRALSYRKKFLRLYNERGFEALVARIEKNAARSRR